MARLISPFLVLLITATVAAVDVNAGPSVEQCEEDGGMTFEDWEEWTPITPKPVISEGHENAWVKIYVDELAEDTYLNAGAPYPECAKIVKPHYKDATEQWVDSLAVMVKMRRGYDSENGDWWYARYDGTGERVWKQGKLKGCIPCHKQAAETDYLFSKEVLDAAKE